MLSMKTSRSQAPWVICPDCGNKMNIQGSANLGKVSKLSCDHCGVSLVCIRDEVFRMWVWETVKCDVVENQAQDPLWREE